MIDKQDFTRLYKPFFQLHPFKKRDWPDGLGEVHYKAFCRDSPALMQESIGLLVEKLDHFPTPKDIRSQITALSASKSEGVDQKRNGTSPNEEIATRYLEHKHEVSYDGEPVPMPENLPHWIKEEVDRVDQMLGNVPLKSKFGSVGLAIAQMSAAR